MKTLFIGSVVEEQLFEMLISKSQKNKPSIAGQRFERMIVTGLNESKDKIELLSYLPTPTFPKSTILYRSALRSHYSNMKLTYMPLVNINILKQIIIALYSFFFLIMWCIKNKDEKKNIFLNVVYAPTALPSILISKIFKVPTVVVVPDVSAHRFNYTTEGNVINLYLTKVNKFISEIFDKQFDGYILLTKEMNKLVNVKGKPYIVIEGMVEDSQINTLEVNNDNKVIMYAGSLREKYGISKLLEAFLKLEIDNVEMWIFGSGDYEKEIIRLSKLYENIKFFGLKTQKEVFLHEQKADLLVNPRPSNEEFTIYSFPSKTLEYMSSGTPMVTTRLPGIPEEYFNYLYTFEDESVDGIKNTLEKLLRNDNEILKSFGEAAKTYVLKNKNYIVQTKKINQFLNTIK